MSFRRLLFDVFGESRVWLKKPGWRIDEAVRTRA
jgi:hypothetical protein